MTNLSVNLNKVALLRNSRTIGIPSVIDAAKTCVDAGAHGITVHPRPDERHIRYTDVYELADWLQGQSGVEFNIEGNPFLGRFMEVVCEVKPDQCTLVPDNPEALTSDHGWDLTPDGDRLIPIIQTLHGVGIRVSLFMDPIPEQMPQAKAVGGDRIELYTEPYATAFREGDAEAVFQEFAAAARAAQAVGLGVNAGHDLNLDNLAKFCTIPGILEVSIGHALTADALYMGFSNAVRAYLDVLKQTQSSGVVR
jgi:pyridoxine 5-phosphate synthase